MLCGVTPGPHELTADQLQQFKKAFVSDLLNLYENGMVVKTPAYPEGVYLCMISSYSLCTWLRHEILIGRLVRVVLIAVCCDHPAMCRMCGFGDHATKTAFCHRCTIPRSALATEQGLTIGGMYIFH